MSKRLEKVSEMICDEAKALLCAVAGPRGWNDTRDAWLSRVARRLGFGHRRAKAIFYGEARIIRAEEWKRLNEEFAALTRSAQQRRETLHDISILARTPTPPTREDPRPLGMDGSAAGATGPWGKRSAG
jgi:hypothetical protein